MTNNLPFNDGDVLYAEELVSEFDSVAQGVIYHKLGLSDSDLKTAGYIFNDSLTDTYDSGNSTVFTEGVDSDADSYYSATSYDEFDDSSVDATLWATSTSGSGTVTEDTTEITAFADDPGSGTGVASFTTNGSTGFDYRSPSGDSIILFKASFRAGTDAYCKLQMTNGSTTVDIGSTLSEISDESPGSAYHYYRLVIDKSAETCTLYEDGSAVATDVDISSVTTNWYVRFLTDTATPNGNASSTIVQYYRHITGSGNSKVYQSGDSSTGGTVTAATLFVPSTSYAANDGTIAITMSADGTNFESPTINTQHEFSNTGTQMLVKFTLTEQSTVDVTSSTKPPQILTGKWGVRFI